MNMRTVKYLFMIKPYANRECIEWIREYLNSLNISFNIEREERHRVVMELDKPIPNTCAVLENVRCVSRVIELKKIVSPSSWSLNDVVKICIEAIKDAIEFRDVGYLDVRRWDKTKKFTSFELGQREDYRQLFSFLNPYFLIQLIVSKFLIYNSFFANLRV